jgi:RimJ/RimL family protein N-acetyltransferase
MKNLPILDGKRIYLRPFIEADIPIYASWLNNPEFRELVNGSKTTAEQMVRNKMSTINDRNTIEYVIVDKASDKPIGNISLDIINKCFVDPKLRSGNLGIMIGSSDNRQRGYGTDAVNIFFEYLKQEWELPYVTLQILTSNKESQIFFKRLCAEEIDSNGTKTDYRITLY